MGLLIFLLAVPMLRGRASSVSLPPLAIPGRGDRVLILVPHPDDETLACGGLIQAAVKRGADVRVVVITSGDAFSIIAHDLFPRKPFTPALFVRLGRMRMSESLTALARLGLPPSHIQFLGYPDGGLEGMWMNFWDRKTPYNRSRTKTLRSPYGGAGSSNYSGESLLNDLMTLLRRYRPTHLYYPYPGDFNRDHRSFAAFTLMALNRLSATDRSWMPPKEASYLVHWGQGWPWPFRPRPDDDLRLPSPVLLIRDRWQAMSLDPPASKSKWSAILDYRSQFASRRNRGFLQAFVRRTEPFSALSRFRPLPNGATLPEPTDSAYSAAFTPASDITRVTLSADRDEIYVRFLTREPLKLDTICRVDLRTVSRASSRWMGEFWLPSRPSQTMGKWSVAGRSVEWRIPREKLGRADAVFLSVATLKGRQVCDRSAWALWSLGADGRGQKAVGRRVSIGHLAKVARSDERPGRWETDARLDARNEPNRSLRRTPRPRGPAPRG
jgi:LmbE family N-acetylglucosaminyl deacetylase